MSDVIRLIVESAILPNKSTELKAVLERLIAHCRETEPGLLGFDWYINADETEVRVIETYANSDAVLFHFQNYASFRPELDACRQLQKATLLGNPNEQLQQFVNSLSAPQFAPFISLE